MTKPDPKLEKAVAQMFNDLRHEATQFLLRTEPGMDIGKALNAVSRLERAYTRFVNQLRREMDAQKK